MKIDPLDAGADLQLLELSRNGDYNAFGQLVRKHYQSCMNVATSILRDRPEAEDKVQQAFYKAFQHRDQYLGQGEFLGWLLRIVVNECRMLIREKKRMRVLYLGGTDGIGAAGRQQQLSSPMVNPENQFLKSESAEVLRTAIRRLPPLFRDVIELHDVKELSMLEVAYELGITSSAAKSRLNRARAELRKRVYDSLGPATHNVNPNERKCQSAINHLRISVRQHDLAA